MATRLVPAYPTRLTDYTQAEGDTYAATLTGKEFGWAVIFNTTITPAAGIIRIWNGTAFESPPVIPPALLPLATTTAQGDVPALDGALKVLRVNAVGDALEYATLPLRIIEMGSATLVAGTIVVASVNAVAANKIILTAQTGNTNLGAVSVSTKVLGVSFTILSTNVLDTRVVDYIIITL